MELGLVRVRVSVRIGVKIRASGRVKVVDKTGAATAGKCVQIMLTRRTHSTANPLNYAKRNK